jgi:hypothetical protein
MMPQSGQSSVSSATPYPDRVEPIEMRDGMVA